jgi:hypothetical protein
MKFRPLIIGSLALGLVAGGVVVWDRCGGETGPTLGSGKVAETQPSKPRVAVTTKSSEANPKVPADQIVQSAGSSRKEKSVAAAPVFRAPEAAITQQELLRRAALVEQEANHDLKNLVGLLDLTEAQQDQIFDTLVRRAPDWHPAMQSGGSSVASGTVDPERPLLDDIGEILTPDQQEELVENDLDRAEWWGEIIEQILPGEEVLATAAIVPGNSSDSNEGTAAAAASPPPEESAPEAIKTGDDAIIFED